MSSKAPNDLGIEIERLIMDAGYMMGHLSFTEQVGGRMAVHTYPGGPEFTEYGDREAIAVDLLGSSNRKHRKA